ncbi:MAG: hypothetical protein KF912_00745 [Phycisphaeraceae bacterium]|nr:hypothetical protein [Phycisphaeraceae bacterium]MBX3365826.1 hypothetical protein [Phycisphaeraceae bacterium]
MNIPIAEFTIFVNHPSGAGSAYSSEEESAVLAELESAATRVARERFGERVVVERVFVRRGCLTVVIILAFTVGVPASVKVAKGIAEFIKEYPAYRTGLKEFSSDVCKIFNKDRKTGTATPYRASYVEPRASAGGQSAADELRSWLIEEFGGPGKARIRVERWLQSQVPPIKEDPAIWALNSNTTPKQLEIARRVAKGEIDGDGLKLLEDGKNG